MGSAREAAMLTLAACERQGAWSDGYLKRILREQGLDKRDAALASRLCYGVLQNKLLLDWHLARFCKSKLTSLDVKVLCDLRVAVYQILFLDKIPPFLFLFSCKKKGTEKRTLSARLRLARKN